MIQLEPTDPDNYFALAKIYEDAGDLRRGRDRSCSRPRTQSRATRPSTCSSPASTTARASSTRRSRRSRSAPQKEPNNPEAFYTIATYYWDEAYRDSAPEGSRQEGLRPEGPRGDRPGAADQARLHRGARLQEPPAPPPGQPREGPGQAAGAHQGGRSAARQGRGNPQDEGRGRQQLDARPARADRTRQAAGRRLAAFLFAERGSLAACPHPRVALSGRQRRRPEHALVQGVWSQPVARQRTVAREADGTEPHSVQTGINERGRSRGAAAGVTARRVAERLLVAAVGAGRPCCMPSVTMPTFSTPAPLAASMTSTMSP